MWLEYHTRRRLGLSGMPIASWPPVPDDSLQRPSPGAARHPLPKERAVISKERTNCPLPFQGEKKSDVGPTSDFSQLFLGLLCAAPHVGESETKDLLALQWVWNGFWNGFGLGLDWVWNGFAFLVKLLILSKYWVCSPLPSPRSSAAFSRTLRIDLASGQPPRRNSSLHYRHRSIFSAPHLGWPVTG